MIFKHYNRIFGIGLAGFHSDGVAVRVGAGPARSVGASRGRRSVCGQLPAVMVAWRGGAPNRMDEWKVAYTCTSRLGAPPLLPALSMATASCGLIVPSAT